MQTLQLKKSIHNLPLHEQVGLLEDVLMSIKQKVSEKIEQTDAKQLMLMYRVFQLNIEIGTFQYILPQLKTTNTALSESVTKFRKKYSHIPIQWSDEEPDGDELFGIWKDNPPSLEQIREKAWKRK